MCVINMRYKNDFFTKEYYEIAKNIHHKHVWGLCNVRDDMNNSNYGSLNIEIVKNNVCQLNCEHCYNNKKKSNWLSYVWLDLMKKIIDQATKKKWGKKIFNKIVLLWWEPTLHPHIKEIVDYIINKGSKVVIVTNWMKFSDPWFAKEIYVPGVILFVHMPFLGTWWKKAQDDIVWVKWFSKKLYQAVKNILEIKEKTIGLQFFGDFVINKKTIKYAYETYVFCRKNNIEPFFERMRIDNDKSNKTLSIKKKDMKNFLYQAYEYDKRNWYFKDKNTDNIWYFLPPIVNSVCLMFKTWLYIEFNKNGFWNCTSCCGQNISHWNILNKKISEILKNKNKILIFKNHKDSIYWPCSICKFFIHNVCQWWCRWNANIYYSCPRASDPNCIFIKNSIKKNPSKMRPNCDGCYMYDICHG